MHTVESFFSFKMKHGNDTGAFFFLIPIFSIKMKHVFTFPLSQYIRLVTAAGRDLFAT